MFRENTCIYGYYSLYASKSTNREQFPSLFKNAKVCRCKYLNVVPLCLRVCWPRSLARTSWTVDWSEHETHMREIQVVCRGERQFWIMCCTVRLVSKPSRRLQPPKQTCSKDGSHYAAAGSSLYPGKYLHTTCSRYFPEDWSSVPKWVFAYCVVVSWYSKTFGIPLAITWVFAW